MTSLAPGDKPGEPSLHISHANSHVDGAEQLTRHWLARQHEDEKKAATEARASKSHPRKKPKVEKAPGRTTKKHHVAPLRRMVRAAPMENERLCPKRSKASNLFWLFPRQHREMPELIGFSERRLTRRVRASC